MAILRHRGSKLYLFTPYSDRSKCRAIPGGGWDEKFKCWIYPFGMLSEIQKQFPDVELPVTVQQYIDIKEAAHNKLKAIQVEGGKWEHPFLMSHQKLCVDIAKEREGFGFFLDTGTGKTITALAVHDLIPGKSLVVCPLAIIRSAWIEDCHNFFPHVKIVSLNVGRERGKKKEKMLLQRLNSDADIYVVNFESFKILFETLKQIHFTKMFVDESSKMKDPTSQITKDLLEFRKGVDRRYPLSGVPAPNSPLEYWAQVEFISPGLLGPSFYSFKSLFFEPDPDNPYKLRLIPAKTDELMDKIKHVALFMNKDDCIDLPPMTLQNKDIDMSDEQRKIYRQMEQLKFAELQKEGRIILSANKLTSLMKLRQITAGFILDEEKHPHFISDTKLKVLKETLDEIGPGQAIIWIQFHEEVNLIKQMIETEYGPHKCRALYGFTNKIEKDIECEEDDQTVRDAVIDGFKKGRFQYLIAHPKTAMYGLTFTNAAYAVYFSLSASYEEFHQSRDRIHRYGQKHNVTYYFLTCNGTIDKALYQTIKQKKKVSEELLEYIRIIRSGGQYDDATNGETERL